MFSDNFSDLLAISVDFSFPPGYLTVGNVERKVTQAGSDVGVSDVRHATTRVSHPVGRSWYGLSSAVGCDWGDRRFPRITLTFTIRDNAVGDPDAR